MHTNIQIERACARTVQEWTTIEKEMLKKITQGRSVKYIFTCDIQLCW